ncbi:alpha/beta fold hydrolase [Chania multitudinisentens]|uniref:alpha/beta fold hydrolase n=1 Tax=Chania multitudinisentens TaxID=1639108 RepID=UPI0003E12B20|nr:alpha/beta fold hydrolase [Chania multitudinisentens]
MNHIVLIHGAWQGGWVWQIITSSLKIHNCSITVIDLPGHGENIYPIEKVTLELYIDQVVKKIMSLNGPVQLIGHSMAGIVISGVAEKIPDKIDNLIYLCAFLPCNGDSVMSLSQLFPQHPQLITNMVEGGLATELSATSKMEIFMHDSSEDIAKLAMSNFGIQAIEPIYTPLTLSQANFGSVKKHYIRCNKDRAIPPELQDIMLCRVPCDTVQELPSGHSPFFSHPMELVETIKLILIQINHTK